MKKFLSALIVFFALAIMLPKISSAAEIPDIRLLNPNQIKLKDVIVFGQGSGRFCTFKCLDRKGKEYTVAYVNFLTNKLGYTVFKHVVHHGLFASDDWQLIYSGAENISPLTTKKERYHVHVDGSKDLIFVAFVDGINMVSGRSESVKPKPAQTSSTPAVKDSGADVPDFLQVCDKNVTYSHNQAAGDGGTFYFYNTKTLSSDLSNNYAEKYIRLLTGSYRFVQHNHEEENYGKTKFDRWTFRYIGSKNVKASSGGYHLELKRFRDYERDRVHFEFAVSKGLTVAGNYSSPRASGGKGDNYCSACGGSGRCSTCGGSGYYHYSDFDQPCGSCLTTGRCSDCDGRGYR